MDKKILSYTAANTFPLKICKNSNLVNRLNNKHIFPLHTQFIPTNRCNLSCTFCSCSKRNKSLELPIKEIIKLIIGLYKLGCEAVTITGGGEPLLHPDINEIITRFSQFDIQIGLVTNGLLLDKLQASALRLLTWCRISCSDERKLDASFSEILDNAYSRAPLIDWAFSYVISDLRSFDSANLSKYVEFARNRGFTHIRVVSDLINLDKCVHMDFVKQSLSGIDDSLVIYQGRKNFVPGQRDCYISLLKPVIGADGYIYPCCGTQYARKRVDLDMHKSMRLGHIRDIEKIYLNQKYFNGRKCQRCYYQGYNYLLGTLLNDLDHVRFV